MLQVKQRLVTLRITDWAWVPQHLVNEAIKFSVALLYNAKLALTQKIFAIWTSKKKSTDSPIQWNPVNTDIKRSYCPWTGCPY